MCRSGTAINTVGVTVVVGTHEHELAARFHKRTILIEKGQVVADQPDGVPVVTPSEVEVMR